MKNLRCGTQSEVMQNVHKNNKSLSKPKIIDVFDKNGVLIGDFDSVAAAMNHVNYKNQEKIYQCLNGKISTAGNLIWKHKNNVDNHVTDVNDYINIGIINGNDFTNYSINSDGIVINNVSRNRIIKPNAQLDGYKYIQLWFSNKGSQTFLVHRLVGKCFLDDGDTYFADDKYVINHKDKNKKNNNYLNLEWVTQKENVIHACAKKINKIDVNTKKIIKTYNSLDEASKDIKKIKSLGTSSKSISTSISAICNKRKGKKTAYGDGWSYCE